MNEHTIEIRGHSPPGEQPDCVAAGIEETVRGGPDA